MTDRTGEYELLVELHQIMQRAAKIRKVIKLRRNTRYPFDLMAVGDSFILGHRPNGAIQGHKRRNGGKFTCRMQPGGKFRVERTA